MIHPFYYSYSHNSSWMVTLAGDKNLSYQFLSEKVRLASLKMKAVENKMKTNKLHSKSIIVQRLAIFYSL